METKPIDFGDIYEITIPQDIATRNFNDLENQGGPHVVICYMNNKPNNTFVAKIYDGVDYPPHGNPGCDLRMEGKACYEYLDCMAKAELDYATETHAYKCFSSFFGGRAGGKGLKVIVPQFNGSFTFEVETHVPERTARWVRIVLMDHYKGAETMEEKIGRARTIDGTVDHGMLPDEKTRLDILRKVSEASNKMWWNVEIGINALGPDKVLILSDGSVKLFGFTCAFVCRWVDQDVFAHPNHRGDRAMMGLPVESLKPESPIIRCWPDRGTGALGPEGALRRWVPERWLGNVNLAAGWLLNTFSDLKGEGFMPLPPWLFPAEVSQRGIGEVVRKRVEGIKRKQVPRASFPSPSTRDVDESAERRARLERLAEEMGSTRSVWLVSVDMGVTRRAALTRDYKEDWYLGKWHAPDNISSAAS